MSKRVLITRPSPDAETFAAKCESAGLEPLLAPLISVRFRPESLTIDNFGAIAFTSANGVRAFAHTSPDRSLPVYCVGQATADAASRAGFATVHIAAGDVDSLAETIANVAAPSTKPVLHVAGTRRAGDLLALLEKAGIAAKRQVLYETQEAISLPAIAAQAFQEPQRLYVPLFSPRTARLLVALIKQAGLQEHTHTADAICLSKAVAEAASGLSWASVSIVSERNANAVLDKIISHS